VWARGCCQLSVEQEARESYQSDAWTTWLGLVGSINGHIRVSGANGITEESKRGKAKGACPASPASAGAPMESANQDQE
jgi:hypothetical protein